MREFKSFRAFGNHLRNMAIESPAVVAKVAEQVGELVEKVAKGEIGHYQPAKGPFVAWAPLKQETELRKVAMDYPINSPLLASGEMRDSISHTVIKRMTGARVEVGSTDQKMVYHEFGTEKIPPRPVIGPAMFTSRDEIREIAGKALFAFLIGRKWKKER